MMGVLRINHENKIFMQVDLSSIKFLMSHYILQYHFYRLLTHKKII